MATILDSKDAINHGQAVHEEWKAKFMAEWYGPMADMALVMVAKQISGLNPVAKAALQAKHPNEMAMIEQMAGGVQ